MPVTVGIPFLDPGTAFEKAIRSVFAQTYADWELLLVDDGSTDGSVERAHAITDPRVRVVVDGKNRGLCARLNEIASLASHPLLCRMDADDVMHPERLRRQVAFMEANHEVDVAGARAVAIDGDDRAACMLGQEFDPSDAERAAYARALFVHPSVIGRTSWFRANPYDPEYPRAEDHELWLRAARRSRYAFLDDVLLFYRQPARFNLEGYVATCRTDRKIYRERRAQAGSIAQTAMLLGRSYSFEAVHRIAAAAGMGASLMRRRGPSLGEGAEAEYTQAFKRAVTADVSGWPGPGFAAAGSEGSSW